MVMFQRLTLTNPLGWAALAAALLAAAPLIGVLYAALGAERADIAASELWRYAATSAVLAVVVGALVAAIGTATAWLTVMYAFPGRRILTWALVLPLAVPGFALAYAYADMLDVGGAFRMWLRQDFGIAPLWSIRSIPGAAFVLSLAFYPYVYLAMRAAFLMQSADLLDASRTLGASRWRALASVAIPVARPALAAGVALAVMETLADYGAVRYLSVQTLTTGVVRAWSIFGSTASAATLALPLMGAAFFLLWVERSARRGKVQEGGRGRLRPLAVTRLTGTRAALATTACALPVILGLILPAAWLAHLALEQTPDLPRLTAAASRSLALGLSGAALTVLLATLLAIGGRGRPTLLRLASLGYATPGAVMAIGLLVPASLLWNAGIMSSGLVIGVSLLLLAYAARLMAAALEPIEAGLERIAPSTRHAARMLGKGPVGGALAVDLPLARGTVLTAALLVFIDIVKELPATLILRPFNFDTLAVIANNYALDERLGQAGLPSLIVVLLALGPVIWLSRRIAAVRPAS